MDIGVARPKAHGQGDDEHGNRCDQAVGEARLRAPQHPREERNDRDRNHQRDEPRRYLVGQSLDWRATALRLRDHAHNLREHGVAADFLGAHEEAARLVHRTADDAGAGFLGGRHRFTGNHRLIERAAPLEDLPVDGYGFTRTHAQQVANDHGLQGHILLAAIGAPAPRTLRRQVQQCLDCAAGLLSGFEFEHLPQEHQ